MATYLWTKINYAKRLFLWLLAYSLLLTGSILVYQYNREKSFKEEELNGRLQAINDLIIHTAHPINADTLFRTHGLRVSVFDTLGHMVYDNTLSSLPTESHLHRQEIAEALEHGSGYAVRRHSSVNNKSYFYSAQKSNDGRIVRTAAPYNPTLTTLLRPDLGFLWFIVGLTILMCIFGFVATRRLGAHLWRLSHFAKRIENGERISDMDAYPHDEIGQISQQLVRLYARLQQTQAQRDKEHRIALHEQKEKERIKKQLTNNINHELKTPVASIQVCVETLLTYPSIAEEKRTEFLERCLANTHRLQGLLRDVAMITRMEDGGQAIAMTDLDLGRTIKEVCAEKELACSLKNISLNIQGEFKSAVHGNVSLLESVFHNLLDNAIAYSGGNAISISMEEGSNGLHIIKLWDNGTGVADEHLPRLFERFYRIDKGRSRASGGTGLGLSIVKNAVLIHGGTITVANRPGGGLEFTITLPRTQ